MDQITSATLCLEQRIAALLEACSEERHIARVLLLHRLVCVRRNQPLANRVSPHKVAFKLVQSVSSFDELWVLCFNLRDPVLHPLCVVLAIIRKYALVLSDPLDTMLHGEVLTECDINLLVVPGPI